MYPDRIAGNPHANRGAVAKIAECDAVACIVGDHVARDRRIVGTIDEYSIACIVADEVTRAGGTDRTGGRLVGNAVAVSAGCRTIRSRTDFIVRDIGAADAK